MSAPKPSKPLNPVGQQSARKSAQKQKQKTVNRSKKVAKRNKIAGPAAQKRINRFQLSTCSYKYLKALTNPWANVSGVCIPDMIDRPSRKLITWQRGTFNINSTGAGWVAASAHANTADGVSVISSLPRQGASAVHYVSSRVEDSSAHTNPQLPYIATVLNNAGYEARLVACGLRARYTGTELSRSGRIIAARCPYNMSFGGHTLGQIITARNEIESWPCDRDWHTIGYIPFSAVDFEYHGYTEDISQNVTNPDNCDLLIMVDGADSTALSGFEWECVRYYEFIPGTNTSYSVDNLTPSHSDMPGMSAMRGFFEGNIDQDTGESYFRKALNYLSTLSPADVSQFVDAGSRVYKMYAEM